MKLQETLEHLNFSRLEAQIYMALIGSEPMSAYQLAKKIAIARPSIYNALEHMLDKGMVELVPDQTALYAAQEPEVLLGRMQAEMTANLSLARQQLEEYETAKQPEVHFVFRGFETAMARAGKLLEDAREEVYLNADFDLSRFAETFHRLKKKGVRIVAFSFYDLGLNREDVELYPRRNADSASALPSDACDRQADDADSGLRCICQLERYGQQQWADGENFIGAYSTRHHLAAAAGKVWTGNALK